MYQLTVSPFGKHTLFSFDHPETGNGFSIVPRRGANVLNIRFNHTEILDGYQTPEELDAAQWGKSVLLFPFPNRLNHGQYSWQGVEYTFPINNAATGNAIHGFVREEAFEVIKIELAKNYASIQCRYEYRGERAYYPFPFELDITFVIADNGTFKVKTACRNNHTAPIPAGFGWHPYFRLTERADDHSLRLPACARVDIDERMIPSGVYTPYEDFSRKKTVGDTFLDNCFASDSTGKYQLVLEAGGKQIAVKADTAQFPFFQVFTPPHRTSIALEPMSCNVDAFNNGDGLLILHAGETWKSAMEIQFKS